MKNALLAMAAALLTLPSCTGCREDALRFDITCFVAPEADEYCLFPANESGGMIQFEPEGVTFLCCLASIGDAFCPKEFLSLDWHGRHYPYLNDCDNSSAASS